MYSQEEIYHKIVSILEEMFEVDPQQVTPDAHLYEDLDIDSIDAVDLIVELKKMTGKKIQPDDFKAVRTVQDVVVEVHKLLSKD
ncbi:MAG: acyl carrier protein [Gammaproteobacteria bacterium]|nr:MAG: acyl carrier protein [Gammaproteobacteria bacterium]RLA52679.1 MAG: acyl carrier protein [Gammaproteobacteria bacterium]